MHLLPAPTGIDHVSLLARNLERTVQFYVNVLGLRIVNPHVDDARSAPDRVWLGDDVKRLITISWAPEGRPGEVGIGTIHHVGLAVASFDALLKWKRWLLSWHDPDGQVIELVTAEPQPSAGEPVRGSRGIQVVGTANPTSASGRVDIHEGKPVDGTR